MIPTAGIGRTAGDLERPEPGPAELRESLAAAHAAAEALQAELAYASEAVEALREALLRALGERDRLARIVAERGREIDGARAEIERLRAAMRRDREAAEQAYGDLAVEYRSMVDRLCGNAELEAREIAAAIEALQTGRAWRLKRALRRLFGGTRR